jgi:hypothetical protein
MLEVNSNLRCYGNTYLEITLHFGHWCGATSVRFPKEAIRNPYVRGDSFVSNMIDARKGRTLFLYHELGHETTTEARRGM